MHMRKQVVEEFEVSFAIEDDHRYAVLMFRRANHPGEVLGNDVLE
jgi:hypothetical protein